MDYSRTIAPQWDFASVDTKQFTHCYHVYPAMMIPQIARTLIKEFRPRGRCSLLFDPYCGSGTSLVEASLAGIDSVGTDLNPLARLLSVSKTTHFSLSLVQDALQALFPLLWKYSPDLVTHADFSRISHADFWYADDVLYQLTYLTEWIETLSPDIRPFFMVALSEVVREASYTRNGEFKRFRIPAAKIPTYRPDVFLLFERKVTRNLEGLRHYNACPTASVRVFDFNSVVSIPFDILPAGSVDMVVTSPPYGDSHTTVAYGQFSRWANEWFSFPHAASLDRLLMGGQREQCDVSTEVLSPALSAIEAMDVRRAREVRSFLSDYAMSIRHVAEVVRHGGRVCYVVGNRTVRGVTINLDYFTIEQFSRHGFRHLDTFVRRIPGKRMPALTSPTNRAGATSSTMTAEYIVILEKS